MRIELKKTWNTSLEKRRVRGDLTEAFNILKEIDNVSPKAWISTLEGGTK